MESRAVRGGWRVGVPEPDGATEPVRPLRTTHHSWAGRLAAGALLLLAAGCEPATVGVTNRAKIVQSVHAQLTVWTRAVNNRSLDTLALLYRREPNLIALWPDGERTRGWNEWTAKWKRGDAGLAQLNYVVEGAVVEAVTGDAGIATFRTSTDAVSAGQRTTVRGRVMQVWTRDPADGRWKIHAEYRGDLPPLE